MIDAITLSLNNKVKIYANLLCDVGVRYPAAFAVTLDIGGFLGCEDVMKVGISVVQDVMVLIRHGQSPDAATRR